MNILLGVCGFGNGHSARQAEILKELNSRGHNVVLFVFSNSKKYVRTHFSNNPAFEVRVPIIHVDGNGIDFQRTANEPLNVFCDSHQINFRAMQSVIDHFQGIPDIVISDYEMIAAQFAYACEVPLVTIDQHSKFAGYELPNINHFTRKEEKSRLNMFFPTAAARYACSFFELIWKPDKQFSVEVVPPILRTEIREAFTYKPLSRSKKKVTVYFSPHVKLRQSLNDIFDVFKKFPQIKFTVFQKENAPKQQNISFHRFDLKTFVESISKASCVITTAGHNLLSELMFLEKPVFVIPDDTFDQQFCAYIISHNDLGKNAQEISSENLEDFFGNLSRYRANIAGRKGIINRFDGLEVLMKKLEDKFGI